MARRGGYGYSRSKVKSRLEFRLGQGHRMSGTLARTDREPLGSLIPDNSLVENWVALGHS